MTWRDRENEHSNGRGVCVVRFAVHSLDVLDDKSSDQYFFYSLGQIVLGLDESQSL